MSQAAGSIVAHAALVSYLAGVPSTLITRPDMSHEFRSVSHPRSGVVHLVLGLCVIGAVALPWFFADVFAGDAVIHLVFGQNAAQGRWYEFNPGQIVSGETSPGALLVHALLFRLLEPEWVPLVTKAMGFVLWYGFLFLLFLGLRKSHRTMAPWATVLVGLMPGAAVNATLGMENIWLAFVVMVLWLLRPKGRTGWGPILLTAGLGALAIWIRPEAMALVGLYLALNVWVKGPRFKWAVAAVLALGLGGASFVFCHHFTGDWIPTSALARRALSALRSPHIGPLIFDTTLLVRMAAYAPLTLLVGVGMWTGRRLSRKERDGIFYWWATSACLVFFVFFTGVYGGDHLARYTLFMLPFVGFLVCRGVRVVFQSDRHFLVARRDTALIVAGVWMLGVFAIEGAVRYRKRNAGTLRVAMLAPGKRIEASERLGKMLNIPLQCPTVIALQEVHLRYQLDDRFAVRALDCRTDKLCLKFMGEQSVDHLGFLAASGTHFLLDAPGYDKPSGAGPRGVLRALTKMKVGETKIVQSTEFVRLAGGPLFSIRQITP